MKMNGRGMCVRLELLASAVAAILLVSLIPVTAQMDISEPLATRTSPVLLQFSINLEGTPVEELFGSEIAVDFLTKDSRVMRIGITTLEGTEGVFSAKMDVPFAGVYKAGIYAEADQNGTVSNGSTDFYFSIEEAPTDTRMELMVLKRILSPGEQFNVESSLKFQNSPLGNLSVNAIIDDVTYTLDWDADSAVYKGLLNAPQEDNMYEVIVYSADDPDVRDKDRVYVVTTEGAKTQCPEDFACNTPEQQRACMQDYNNNVITETDMITCSRALYSKTSYNIYCDLEYKGDFDADANFYDSDDAVVMNQILQRPEEQRAEFIACADYDEDGDVDDADQLCMENVKIGQWFPELCVDIDAVQISGCQLMGDLSLDRKIDGSDVVLMDNIIRQIDENPELDIPAEVFDCMDFNDDDKVDETDVECQGHFALMDLSHERPMSVSRTIPKECMLGYHLDQCHGIAGDLNGDNTRDIVDNLLLILLVDGAIDRTDYPGIEACADINSDGYITKEDETCFEASLKGDSESNEFFRACLGCDENIGPYYSDYEICNDGYDNDCDGLIDRTSLNPAEDQCICSAKTACTLPWDTYPPSPGVSDMKVKFCYASNRLSSDFVLYSWQDPPKCNQPTHCMEFECGKENEDDPHEGRYKCFAYKYRKLSKPGWLRSSPGSENSKRDKGECENNIDEDCSGSDKDCDEEYILGIIPEDMFDELMILLIVATIVVAVCTAGAASGLVAAVVAAMQAGWVFIPLALAAAVYIGKEALPDKASSRSSLVNSGYSGPHAVGIVG